MEKIKMVCPCLLGLEGLVADELRYIGAENVEPENGRVVFQGDFNILARANISLHCAERVLILMSSFTAKTFEELFQGVKAIPWENFIGKKDAFPVKGRALSSMLMSIPDCQSIIKKAVAERLKSKYKISWFEESGSLFQIQFLIMKDKVSIMIDTSGVGLHKRGYREISAQAPIKETLAAAMVELSRVRKFHTVIDPFCGSGTILIESAMKAMNIAPGLNRTFAAQKFGVIPQNAWQQEFEKARSNIITDCEFQAFGYDIDESTLQIARENAKKANVSGKVVFAKRDIRDFAHETEKGTVICNPPYGERLLDVKSAEELYKVMGEKFIQKSGWSYAIISPDSEFEQIFGRKADKRRKLYNGMIPCQVYMYFK